jgi:hypothetical protein
MPQSYDAGSVFLARAVLEAGQLEGLETATRLSPPQLAYLRETMEAVHRLRRIPAGDLGFIERARDRGGFDMSRTILIDDERLQYIWNRFRGRAVVVFKVFSRRSHGLQLATQLAAGFQTGECRALLRRYRAAYDRRHDGCNEAALLLRRAILAYVVAKIDPVSRRGLLEELFEA